jgi:hypothetical protein
VWEIAAGQQEQQKKNNSEANRDNEKKMSL